MDLRVSRTLSIPAVELEWRFSRASGPGGQHVNTSSTRVELSWNIAASHTLSPGQRERLLERLSSRLTDGNITVSAAEQRSQLLNRRSAQEKLGQIIAAALAPESAQAQGNEANEGIPTPPLGDQGPALADQGAAAAADPVIRGGARSVDECAAIGAAPMPARFHQFPAKRGAMPRRNGSYFGSWPLAVGPTHRAQGLSGWDSDSAVERSWSRWRKGMTSPRRSRSGTPGPPSGRWIIRRGGGA